MKSILFLVVYFTSMTQDSSRVIYEFSTAGDVSSWNVVNDGVMGGLSKGDLSVNDNGNGLFEGYVTTANNGGFSSIRYSSTGTNVADFDNVVLRVKGDGKSYQFRIKEKASQRYSYIATFNTTGEWQTVEIPLRSFYPSFRGNTLDKPNFSGDAIAEITFLIGNKRNENFSLEIESISLN